MSFTLPKLSYAHNALEPNIDSKTMEIHHGKHHQGYTNNLNGAIEGTELEGKSIEDILATMDMSNSAVRNNGGGFYNHSLFWEVMSPEGGGLPTGELADAINESFEILKNLKLHFLLLLKHDLALAGPGYVFIKVENLKFVRRQIKTIL
jgi:Fe-Mn family superoxide dismutase